MTEKMFLASLALSVSVAAAVTATPVHANEVQNVDFKDVSKQHGMYTEIMQMRDEGIIFGYQDNTFKPSQAISRVQVAALLNRSLDLKPVREGKEFKDVPKTSSHYENVQAVYRAGVFDGNSNGTFGAADNLTRAQMSKVLVNAFTLKLEKGFIFDDINEGHWYKDYVATLYANGITAGNNGKYLPNDSVTRAQYAAFLFRALYPENSVKHSKPLQPTPPVKPTSPSNAKYPSKLKVTKADEYYTYYDYKTNLNSGVKIFSLSHQKYGNKFLFEFTTKADTYSAKYLIDTDSFRINMVSETDLSQDDINEIYEIMQHLASVK